MLDMHAFPHPGTRKTSHFFLPLFAPRKCLSFAIDVTPFSPPHPVLEVARTAPTLVEKSGAAEDLVSLSWQSPADLRKHTA